MNFLAIGIFLPRLGLLSELDERAFTAADPRERTEERAWPSRPIWNALPVTSKPSSGRRGLVRRLARIVKRTPSAAPVRPSADPRAEQLRDGRRGKDVFRLTDARVAALRVEDRPDFVFQDKELVSFGVRVYCSGRKVYVVRTRGPDGVSKQVTIGSHVEITAERARQQARTVIDRIKRGLDTIPRPEPTVADLAERYLEAHVAVNCRPSTQETFQRLVDMYILPELGDIAATALQRSHVRALHDALADRPYQANQVVRVLSKMFDLGMAWGMIPARRNPCRFVRMYRERRRERVLTAEEWRRLGRVLDEAEADFSVFPPAIATIRLLLLTGCRKSEILNLRWEDIDRTSGELLIRDGKTGARRVTLTPAVDWLLERIPRIQGNPWVIVGKNPGDRLKGLDTIWLRLRGQAGLDDVRIHDFRHSYANRGLALSGSLLVIGKILGHRRMATTARYAHPSWDEEKVAAAKVGDSIGSDLWAYEECEDEVS